MRTSTIPFASVRQMAHDAAGAVTALLMYPRDKALHGRAPRDPQTHQRRRNIACGRATPAAMLLEQSFTDLMDGASVAQVTEPYRLCIAILEASASRGCRVPTNVASLLPVMLRETRAQAALDEAQARVLANPDDPAALAAVLECSAAYDAAQLAVEESVRSRLARATANRRVPVPA